MKTNIFLLGTVTNGIFKTRYTVNSLKEYKDKVLFFQNTHEFIRLEDNKYIPSDSNFIFPDK